MTRILFTVGLMSVLASAITGQQRSVVHGVRLVASVRLDGRAAVGLASTDFEVRDEGVLQRVDSAVVADRVTVALAVDVSLSVRERDYERTLTAISAIADLLAPKDRAGLVAFSDRIATLVPPTEDREVLRRGLARLLDATGAAPVSIVWDAAMAAASLVATDDAPSLVLLISDGMDNASWLDRDELADTFAQAGVNIDLIKVPWEIRSFDEFGPGRQLPESLAKRAGGSVLDITDGDFLNQVRARLAELRRAYVLTYTPTGVKIGDGWHRLKVDVRRRGAQVRTRSGYWSTTR